MYIVDKGKKEENDKKSGYPYLKNSDKYRICWNFLTNYLLHKSNTVTEGLFRLRNI